MHHIITVSMSNTSMLFDEYLKRNISEKGGEYTHTRIGDPKLKIACGSYLIKNEEEFLKNYRSVTFSITNNIASISIDEIYKKINI